MIYNLLKRERTNLRKELFSLSIVGWQRFIILSVLDSFLVLLNNSHHKVAVNFVLSTELTTQYFPVLTFKTLRLLEEYLEVSFKR
jgi:hypothetical protein